MLVFTDDESNGMVHAITGRVETCIAIPIWRERVSTVCDFSRRVLLVDVQGNRELSRSQVLLSDEPALQRAARLERLGVQVLICGAISRPLAWFIKQEGIKLVPYVSGPVDEVLAAYLCGRLTDPRFLLPGSPPAERRRWRYGRGFREGRK